MAFTFDKSQPFSEQFMITKNAPKDQKVNATYQIDESARRKILFESPAAKVREQIERERQAFILANGSAFGETL
jgi:hypothetical protein